MNRTLRGISAGLLLIVLTACTQGAPTGATLPPLTTSAADTSAASMSASASASASSTGGTSDTEPTDATTAAAPPVDVTVPAEASALPLPTEQIDIPADNAQEEADRAAIESVWRQVWDLVRDGYEMDPAALNNVADELMVNPIRQQIVDGSISGRAKGRVTYGDISIKPYWYQSIGGAGVAQIGDCMDFSQFGVKDSGSGEIITTGQTNSNTVGTFVKSTDGRWMLTQVTTMTEVPCTTE